MKKYIAILIIIFISACSEIEVKPESIDPYVGDPVSEAAKERGITIN